VYIMQSNLRVQLVRVQPQERMNTHLRLGFVGVLLGVGLGVFGLPVVDSLGNTTPAAEASTCARRVPWVALTGSSFGHGGTGAFTVGAFGSSATATAGGSTLVAATGTFAAAAGAFLAASWGTCRALDVIVGDGASVTAPSITPTSSFQLSSPLPCAGYTSVWPAANATGGISPSPTVSLRMCRELVHPSINAAGQQYSYRLNDADIVRGGVTMPRTVHGYSNTHTVAGTPYSGYSVFHNSWSSAYPYAYQSNIVTGGLSGSGSCYGLASLYIGHTGCQSPDLPHLNNTQGYALLEYPCGQGSATFENVGSMCGMPPDMVWSITPQDGASNFAGFVNAWPEVRAKGWTRQFVWDVQCRNGSNGSTTWVREVSEPFWDATPNLRPQVPQCAIAGHMPVKYTLARYPTGVTLPAPGSALRSDYIISTWDAPSSWLQTTYINTWMMCLTAGNNCGSPELVNGVCIWGGYSVGADYCSATEVSGPGTPLPAAMPVATPVVAPAGALVPQMGPTNPDPLSTATPVLDPSTPTTLPGTGTGTGTDVPIDRGTGPIPTPIADDDFGGEGVCWPSGWGWFNPAQWVLRPIKCALVWAFVPSDPGSKLAAMRDDFAEVVPFSLIADTVEILDVATAAPAGGAGCIVQVQTPNGVNAQLCGSDVNIPAGPWNGVIWFAMVGTLILGFALSVVRMLG
jgi:hypothetical protein